MALTFSSTTPPPESLSPELRVAHERRAERVAALGERFLSVFAPEVLHCRLVSLGFCNIEDLGPRQIAARYFPNRASAVPEAGGHVLRASTVRQS